MRALLATVVAVLVAAPIAPATATAARQDCQQLPAPGGPLPDGPAAYLERLGLPNAHTIATGAGVRVGVIDSGVNWQHPKLGTAAVPSPGIQLSATYGQPPQAPGVPVDCEGHGTAVAGLIAARKAGDDKLYGVAPEATIYPVRFATSIEQLPRTLIAGAITDAVQHGARVLNLSFTLADDPLVRAAVANAIAQGVVVVAAAGNEGTSRPGMTPFPAAYPGVLGVAAVDGSGKPTKESNAGEWVDIAAPGTDLPALSPDGQFVTVSGTSFAAALVSGAAALVAQRFPDATPAEITDRLTTTAIRVRGGRDDQVGAGVVDPYAALTALSATPPAAAPAAAGDIGRMPPSPDTGLDRGGRVALGVTAVLLLCMLVAAVAGAAVRTARRRAPAGSPRHPPPETELR